MSRIEKLQSLTTLPKKDLYGENKKGSNNSWDQ